MNSRIKIKIGVKLSQHRIKSNDIKRDSKPHKDV